jgi:hypothetical protein
MEIGFSQVSFHVPKPSGEQRSCTTQGAKSHRKSNANAFKGLNFNDAAMESGIV